VQKPISPTHLLQQTTLNAVVEKADVSPRGIVVEGENETEAEVLNEGKSSAYTESKK